MKRDRLKKLIVSMGKIITRLAIKAIAKYILHEYIRSLSEITF